MAKFYSNVGGDPLSETGNWNIASDYASLKIMKPLYLADEYETIARFGAVSFFEQFGVDKYGKDFIRIKALERLCSILILLIDNTKFAIIYQEDKKKLEEYKDDLTRLKGMITLTYSDVRNEVKKMRYLEIDEKNFINLLDTIIEIKSKINEPLNKSHLIFVQREVYDPREQKKKIIDEAIKRG